MLNLIGLAINILASDGTHYVNAIVPDGGYILYGNEELYYEEKSINQCKEITLPAGNYRVELLGGRGGGDNLMFSSAVNPLREFYNFSLDTDTTVTLFRGGDGVVTQASVKSIPPGAGSSGVDSFVIINGQIIRSIGGTGMYIKNQNSWIYSESIGGTGGANEIIKNYYGEDVNCGRHGLYASNSGAKAKLFAAGGGGGAPDGTSYDRLVTFKTSQYEFCTNENSNCGVRYTAGNPATDTGGGNGGDVYITYKDWSKVAHGGRGGKNVHWSCGGTNAVSYGGGGAGGTCKGGFIDDTEPECYDGTDGGSGSSNSSDTSFIKIYKYK